MAVKTEREVRLLPSRLHQALYHQSKSFPLRGRGLGYVTIFQILGSLYIFGTVTD